MNNAIKIFCVVFVFILIIVGCGSSREGEKVYVIGGNDYVRLAFRPTISAEFFI